MKSEAEQQKSQEDSRTTTDSEPESETNEKTTSVNPTLLETIAEKDKAISSYIHNLETNYILELLIYSSGRLFNPDIITCYFVILIAYHAYYFHNYFYVVKPLIHVLVVLVITIVMKHLLGRHRPHQNNSVIRRFNLRSKEKNCSMPSGDSMQCASFSIIFLFYMNSPFGFVLIPLVMFSRVFFFCHFLMDTIVGTILGFIISYSLVIALRMI